MPNTATLVLLSSVTAEASNPRDGNPMTTKAIPSSPTRRAPAVVSAPINQVKAEFFKVLGHPARIRVLEVLRDGERSVSDLIPDVGIEASHLSQQLGIMRRANLIKARKEGAGVVYSVGNPMLFELLDVAKQILTSSLAETRDLLTQLETVEVVPRPKRR